MDKKKIIKEIEKSVIISHSFDDIVQKIDLGKYNQENYPKHKLWKAFFVPMMCALASLAVVIPVVVNVLSYSKDRKMLSQLRVVEQSEEKALIDSITYDISSEANTSNNTINNLYGLWTLYNEEKIKVSPFSYELTLSQSEAIHCYYLSNKTIEKIKNNEDNVSKFYKDYYYLYNYSYLKNNELLDSDEHILSLECQPSDLSINAKISNYSFVYACRFILSNNETIHYFPFTVDYIIEKDKIMFNNSNSKLFERFKNRKILLITNGLAKSSFSPSFLASNSYIIDTQGNMEIIKDVSFCYKYVDNKLQKNKTYDFIQSIIVPNSEVLLESYNTNNSENDRLDYYRGNIDYKKMLSIIC